MDKTPLPQDYIFQLQDFDPDVDPKIAISLTTPVLVI